LVNHSGSYLRTTSRFDGTIVRVAAFAFALTVGGLFAVGPAPSIAAVPVETFVQQNVDAGVTILQDKAKPENERRAKFREFLLGLLDLKRIALFTLGPWRRNASQTDLDAFVEAFRNFALANYDSRIKGYGGEALKVIGSRANGHDDYVVVTKVVDPADPTSTDPLEVDLRVLSENGRFVVVDASVEGIWLALTEREDFTSFLGQNNGNMQALVERVRQLTAKLIANEPSTNAR